MELLVTAVQIPKSLKKMDKTEWPEKDEELKRVVVINLYMCENLAKRER